MKKLKKSKEIALGGLMTALCVIIMCFGTMLPFMTYVSPVFCLMIGGILLKIFSRTGFISWYIAVAVLSVLLCPDKEAAAVFTAFGVYPLVRIWLNNFPFKWLFKLLYFNAVTLLLYWLLLHVIGLQELAQEFSDVGKIMTLCMLFAGNLIFIILDRLLWRLDHSKKYKFMNGR